MKLLNNGAYYSRTSGDCYKGINNAIVSCDFSKTGLTNYSKNMIDIVTWNLGANPEANNITFTPNDFYNIERGNAIGKVCNSGLGCNDNVTRKLSWNGKVGLMYTSDYGYATSNRTCLSKTMDSVEIWNTDCYENDWLYKNSVGQWILNPFASDTANIVLNISSTGRVFYSSTNNWTSVRPTNYLKLDIKVLIGNGSLDFPYEIIV